MESRGHISLGAMPTRGTVAARVASRSAGSLMAAADLEGTLTLYLASGKKKHDRIFWVSSVERGEISWDKKRCAPLPHSASSSVLVTPLGGSTLPSACC